MSLAVFPSSAIDAQRDGAPLIHSPSDIAPVASPARLTLGVEEEFHLVDLSTRRLTARAGEVLARLTPISDHGEYTAELQQSVVETNSAVSSTLEAQRQHLLS
jgi:hypothetical protein